MSIACSTVTVRAPGKINLYLGVGGLRIDGYHTLATVFQSVNLYEEVVATVNPVVGAISVSFSGPQHQESLPIDDSNLVIRAAKLLARTAAIESGIVLRVTKNIPIAGGMAGGSADAAATLLACDTIWQTRFGLGKLMELAAELGADVPFCLHGGTAIGVGRGDQLSPVLTIGIFHWVLAFADFGLSTSDVFEEYDKKDEWDGELAGGFRMEPSIPDDLLAALRAGSPQQLAPALYNNLHESACRLAPQLRRTLQIGDDAGALAGIISGSGPTVAFLCADTEAALSVRIALSAAQIRTESVCSSVGGARIVARG